MMTRISCGISISQVILWGGGIFKVEDRNGVVTDIELMLWWASVKRGISTQFTDIACYKGWKKAATGTSHFPSSGNMMIVGQLEEVEIQN
jgi:hypothetical protein